MYVKVGFFSKNIQKMLFFEKSNIFWLISIKTYPHYKLVFVVSKALMYARCSLKAKSVLQWVHRFSKWSMHPILDKASNFTSFVNKYPAKVGDKNLAIL